MQTYATSPSLVAALLVGQKVTVYHSKADDNDDGIHGTITGILQYDKSWDVYCVDTGNSRFTFGAYYVASGLYGTSYADKALVIHYNPYKPSVRS